MNWIIDNNRESFSNLFDFWFKLLRMHEYENGRDSVSLRKDFYSILSESAAHIENFTHCLNLTIENLTLEDILHDSFLYPDERENLDKLLYELTEGSLIDYTAEDFVKLGKPHNQVTVSTRHSSKGLEFEVIILLGMEEDHFPSYWSIKDPDPTKLEEEHRLFFVCLSRSKRVCYLLKSTYYANKYGRKFKKQPSRFWNMLISHYG